MATFKPSHVRQLFPDVEPQFAELTPPPSPPLDLVIATRKRKGVLTAKRRFISNPKTIEQLFKNMTLVGDPGAPLTDRKRKQTAPRKFVKKALREPAVIAKYFPSETIVVKKNEYGLHVYKDFVFIKRAITGKYTGDGKVVPLTEEDVELAKELKLVI